MAKNNLPETESWHKPDAITFLDRWCDKLEQKVLWLEARARGDMHYSRGWSCSYNHPDKWMASSKSCATCSQIAVRKWEKENPIKVKSMVKKGRIRNAAKIRDEHREYCRRNPDKVKKWAVKIFDNDPEHCRAVKRAWQRRNKDLVNARVQHRYVMKKTRMLKGITFKKDIFPFFEEAARKREETGIKHEVDHIIPLQGDTVCGLHVPWNLRVISKSENAGKQNKLIEGLGLHPTPHNGLFVLA